MLSYHTQGRMQPSNASSSRWWSFDSLSERFHRPQRAANGFEDASQSVSVPVHCNCDDSRLTCSPAPRLRIYVSVRVLGLPTSITHMPSTKANCAWLSRMCKRVVYKNSSIFEVVYLCLLHQPTFPIDHLSILRYLPLSR